MGSVREALEDLEQLFVALSRLLLELQLIESEEYSPYTISNTGSWTISPNTSIGIGTHSPQGRLVFTSNTAPSQTISVSSNGNLKTTV